MTGTHGSIRVHAVTAACILALAQAPTEAHAQVGAIGAAPVAVVSGDRLDAGTTMHVLQPPILSQSGMQLGAGQGAGSLIAASTLGSVDLFTGAGLLSVDFTYNEFVIGGYYAPSDRLSLGLAMFPYIGVELEAAGLEREEASGRGDAARFGKYQLWRSANGRTRISGIGSVGLPIGESDYGAHGASFGIGGAASHQLDRVSLHGSVSVAVPTDDRDGDTVLTLSAAAVYALSPRVALALELTRPSTSDVSYVHFAPGARFRIGNRASLAASLLTNVASSVDVKPFNHAIALGLEVVR